MSQYLSGLPAWLVQRLSALYLLLFTLFALFWWWWALPLDYMGWRAIFSAPLSGIATSMAFIALFLHVWVGVRNVILDYAGRNTGMRLLLLSLLGGWLIALALWVIRLLFRSLSL